METKNFIYCKAAMEMEEQCKEQCGHCKICYGLLERQEQEKMSAPDNPKFAHEDYGTMRVPDWNS